MPPVCQIHNKPMSHLGNYNYYCPECNPEIQTGIDSWDIRVCPLCGNLSVAKSYAGQFACYNPDCKRFLVGLSNEEFLRLPSSDGIDKHD